MSRESNGKTWETEIMSKWAAHQHKVGQGNRVRKDIQRSQGKAGTGVELREINDTSKESRKSEMKSESWPWFPEGQEEGDEGPEGQPARI